MASDDEVEINVKDEGVGIAPDHLEQVFERFYQVGEPTGSRRGMGMGLAIVRRFVELQGGRLWVDSVPGSGSTFSFTLPIVAIDAPGPSDTETGTEASAAVGTEAGKETPAGA